MAQSQTSFSERTNPLFLMAKDLSQEFSAHVAIVTFSLTSEPKAYEAPTANSVLRTYLPEIHSLSFPAWYEMVGEATGRVDGMKREVAHQAAAWSKILVAQTSVGKQNWWEVDVEALRVQRLVVFVKALEVLRIDVQCHLDVMESSRKEKMSPLILFY
uniref:Uncharacterized protein n=1 Tax=Setaria italica TaxID=4555 RepID=K3YLH5_SETIT